MVINNVVVSDIHRLVTDLCRDPAAFAQRAGIKLRLADLRLTNRPSRRLLTGSVTVVINVTSFGHRINFAHYAL